MLPGGSAACSGCRFPGVVGVTFDAIPRDPRPRRGTMSERAVATKRPARVGALLALLVFQGVSGLAGGAALVLDPTGAALGIPQEWLRGSPFDSYLIPGLVLFFLLGALPLVVAWGVRSTARWSWIGALGIGAALVVWIAVQISIVGYQPSPPLQVVYGGVGLAILGLSLTPSVRGRLA
jgi:hypothetical protein